MPTAKAKATVSPEEAAGAAKGWEPQPGDNLTGEIVYAEWIESDYGKYPMFTLSTADGFVNLHAFHQVLQGALRRMHAAPGTKVSVTYHGKQDTKKDKDGNARQFHNYTVRDPDKAAEDFVWDSDDPADAAF